jgi:small subunit ribosomal protein S17
MTETAKTGSRRKTQIGHVVSVRMQKTIVVEVTRQKAHTMYRRVLARSRKFYAHDEQNTARVGDVVRIEETRPLSKLKRWRLLEIIRRASLAGQEAAALPEAPAPEAGAGGQPEAV